MEVFETIGNRAAMSAIEKYGVRNEQNSEIDRIETYNGPNIRSFMARQNLDPSAWRQVLEYNRIGSVIDLVEGQTQLAIPNF